MKYLQFCLMILFATLSACKMNKVYEIKNDKGVVMHRITVLGDTSNGKNGLYESFDEQGRPIEAAEYHDGKLQGTRKLYEDGAIYSIETRNADLFEGKYQAFHKNGQVSVEGIYVNNVMSGEWVSYYPSGAVKDKVIMKDNAENGPFTEYYENGKIKAQGSFLDGPDEEGELLMYDSTGSLEKKMDCKKGICKTLWKKDSL